MTGDGAGSVPTAVVDELQAFCTFGEERVYLLVAIARSKENPDVTSSTQPTIREVVADERELPEKIAQLDHAAARFDSRFRLYLTVNARNTTTACFALRRGMDDWLEMRLHGNEDVSKKFKRLDREWKSVLQSDECKDETYFIFDLDDASAADVDHLEADLAAHTPVEMRRETPNGYHLVTEPFNYTELDTDVEYELKTDGMVFVSFIGER